MGYNSPHLSYIPISCTSGDPLDSTTYYFGGNGAFALGTDLTRQAIPIPNKCIIRGIIFRYYSSVDCTTEDVAFSIRVNNTTDTAVYTGSFANANSPISKLDLAISLTSGDYIAIKMVTPAWVTNPTTTSLTGLLLVETMS